MRSQGRMAGLQGNRLFRVNALSHPGFGLRRDHTVIGRDLIPTRLHLPRRRSGLIVETARRDRLLRMRHHERLSLVEILAEAFAELVPVDPEKSVLVRADTARARRWLSPGEDAGKAISLIGSKRGHVNETYNIRRVPRAGDYCSTVGMTNQQGRGLLRGCKLARPVDILGQ